MDDYRSLVDQLLKRQTRMESDRSPFDAIYQEIAERIIPRRALFTRNKGPNTSKGRRQTTQIFDAVPALALDKYASAVHSLVTPKGKVWHKVKSNIDELNDNLRVQRYFEELNCILFDARYAGNFDNQVHECYYDHGAFATAVMHVCDTGQRLAYRAIPMHQVYLAENAHGMVDLVHRKYTMTARQAVAEFKDSLDMLHDGLKRAAKDTPEKEFTFLHVCEPAGEWDTDRMDWRGMPFRQYEICVDFRRMCEISGYWAFPYPTTRYSTSAGEVYGRGPAELVLPDVKMLNEMNKTTLQAAQLKVLPPLLAPRQGVLDTIRMTPAAVNYGGVNQSGQQLVHPLNVGGDVGLGLDLMDQKRRVVQDAFWNTLFQILVDQPNMTATEAMLRAQEKGALLAPTASRIESEFLQTCVTAEIHYLARAGILPEQPPEITEAGAGFTLEYDSPMARARKAEMGIGMLRTWEQLAPLAQAMGEKGATLFRRFNPDKSAQILAEVNGYPADAIYTDDELAAMDEQEKQAQAMATMVQAAPQIASAAKDLAQAQALSGAMPASSPVPV